MIGLQRSKGRVCSKKSIVIDQENVTACPTREETNSLKGIVTGSIVTVIGSPTSEETNIPNVNATASGIKIVIVKATVREDEARVGAGVAVVNVVGKEIGVVIATVTGLDPVHAIDIGIGIGSVTETGTGTVTVIRRGSVTGIMIEIGTAGAREVHPVGISAGAAEAPDMINVCLYHNVQFRQRAREWES